MKVEIVFVIIFFVLAVFFISNVAYIVMKTVISIIVKVRYEKLNTERINITLSPALLKEIDKYCVSQDMSRSAFVRRAINHYISVHINENDYGLPCADGRANVSERGPIGAGEDISS